MAPRHLCALTLLIPEHATLPHKKRPMTQAHPKTGREAENTSHATVTDVRIMPPTIERVRQVVLRAFPGRAWLALWLEQRLQADTYVGVVDEVVGMADHDGGFTGDPAAHVRVY